MEGLTEGRIVHYVLPDGPSVGQHRPAIVVKVWDGGYKGCCQLVVFKDGSNDCTPVEPYALVEWRTSVLYSAEKLTGTWHWIEKA